MLLTGTVVSVSEDNGITMAKVNAHGAIIHVSLALVPNAREGTRILAEGGVAISIIKQEELEEEQHVPRNSR
jgi:hydrogenase maturation factor